MWQVRLVFHFKNFKKYMNIVAYGSLMNRSSLEKTLERQTELAPIQIHGFRRVFNAPFDGYGFLNLVPSDGSVVEAAYFELVPHELEKFKKREEGSVMCECTPGFFAFYWEHGQDNLPVLQSYIDVCESGANELGIDMWKSTNPIQTIEDDRSKPKYP